MNETHLNNEIYTVVEISELLKVKRLTVIDWIKKGKIKAVRIGRQYRIPKDYLDEFIKANIVANKS